jgi:MerR family transcriptional regulator, heat shock protein HspR
MTFQRDEPVFAIGIVARVLGVHQQTLRNYERWGLVVPARSAGGTRYYSQADVDRLQKIREWMDVLGINRAGVEVMTRLLRRIEELELRVEGLSVELIRVKQGMRQLPGAASTRNDNTR